MIHAKEKGKSARRIKEVDEIISVKQETAEAETFRSVEWNPSDDTFVFNKDSHLLKKIAHNKGTTVEEAIEEISRRKTVLDWMVKNNIKDYVEVCRVINEYYKNPEKIMKQIGTVAPIEEPKPVEVKEVKGEKVETKEEIKPKKIPISQIFGYKVISEK
jgi:ribosomal protein S19